MKSTMITGLTNDQEYGFRLYPRNLQGQYQTELDGAVVATMPQAGILLNTLPAGTTIKADTFSFVASPADGGSRLIDLSSSSPTMSWSTKYNNNGWVNSLCRTYANGTYYDMLPQVLKKHMVLQVTNQIGNTEVYPPSDKVSSSDYVKVPTESEISIPEVLSKLDSETTVASQWYSQTPISDYVDEEYLYKIKVRQKDTFSSPRWANYETTSKYVYFRGCVQLNGHAIVDPIPNTDGSYNLI